MWTQSVTSLTLCSRPSVIAVVADFLVDRSQRAYLKLHVVNWSFDPQVLMLLVIPAPEEDSDQHRVPRFRIRPQPVSTVGTVCTYKRLTGNKTGSRKEILTLPMTPRLLWFSHLLSPYTHPSGSVRISSSSVSSELGGT